MSNPTGFARLAAQAQEALAPKEQLQAVTGKARGLAIVVPKEIEMEETRLALTPDAVALLVSRGHQVAVQNGAGNLAKFSDREYSEAGAQIMYSAHEVFASGDVVMKINPPTPEEINLIKPGSAVISALQTSQINTDYVEAMNARRITGVAFELLEDEVGNMPVVRAMSEIAGSVVLLIAAEYLSSAHDGRGVILGGITGVPPTKVVILGAGTVGEYAARTAIGLGAEVKIFDNHLYKLRRIKQELGQQIFTSTIDLANLTDALIRADVVIGALRTEDSLTSMIISEAMVSKMKENSVIVDVSIDQGGCFETSRITTHSNPVFKKYGVIHFCVPNVAARVAHTATSALSNIFAPILLAADQHGGVEDLIFTKDWFMKGVYCYKGTLTHKGLARRLNMRYKDMGLFRMARM
jgi:alanine dehydrogenase